MTSLIPPRPPLSRDDGRLNVERRLGQRQVSTVELQVDGVSAIIELPKGLDSTTQVKNVKKRQNV